MWRRYLRFWGADPPADVDAEIDFHLEELVRHLVARGMTPEQARAEASKRFGNVARVRSECVSVDEGSMKAATRREARDALSQDIRDGFRALRGNSTFTVGAAVILALGIGFNTTVFSFNKALLFPSLPIADPPGIARMWSQNTARGILVQPLSEGDVADLFAASQSFEEIAGYAIQRCSSAWSPPSPRCCWPPRVRTSPIFCSREGWSAEARSRSVRHSAHDAGGSSASCSSKASRSRSLVAC